MARRVAPSVIREKRRQNSPRRPVPARATGPQGAQAAAGSPSASGTTVWGLAPWVIAGLAASLVLLLAHAWSYRFLTDDAFISFRYSRNLSQGHGLVFNPGFEAVEGYSNFLWVLMLALLDRLGVPPESAALPLTLLATVVLWALVLWAALQHRLATHRQWLILVPMLGLAATRSVAVWSSSGLETRWFEVLVVAAALRMIHEVERERAGVRVFPMAACLWGLAAWTRPDAMLLAASAFMVRALWLGVRWSFSRRMLIAWAPFVVMVGAHVAFRLLYYHAWLPNTYYAKVDGHLWWDSGFRYLSAFVLEYGLYLWVPLVVAGVLLRRREKTLLFPGLALALVLPHALYVASVGGDHFEYRPLDLYFPFLFLMLLDGARAWSETRRGTLALAVMLAVIGIGVWEIPYQTRRQFPTDYVTGYPGQAGERMVEAREFLSPDADPIYRWPLLRTVAKTHQHLVMKLSHDFVGLRQEEHRMFLATVVSEGRRLKDLVQAGLLPPDLHIATDCVGAIPYYSGLRTLDRLGLTDAHVAHSPFAQMKIMAHGKHASMDYARQRGVDLWAVDAVHLLFRSTDDRLMRIVRRAAGSDTAMYGAPVGPNDFLLCVLPLGEAHARQRMPALALQSLGDPAFVGSYIATAAAAFQDSLAMNPGDPSSLQKLAYLTVAAGDYRAALQLYRELVRRSPEQVEAWESLALCYGELDSLAQARDALRRALWLADRAGQRDASGRIRWLMSQWGAAAAEDGRGR